MCQPAEIGIIVNNDTGGDMSGKNFSLTYDVKERRGMWLTEM